MGLLHLLQLLGLGAWLVSVQAAAGHLAAEQSCGVLSLEPALLCWCWGVPRVMSACLQRALCWLLRGQRGYPGRRMAGQGPAQTDGADCGWESRWLQGRGSRQVMICEVVGR